MKSFGAELRVLRIPLCAILFFVAGSLLFAFLRIPVASFVSSVLVRSGETPVFTKANRTDPSRKFAPKEKLSRKASGGGVRRKTGQIQAVASDRIPLFALDSGAGKVMADSCLRTWQVACLPASSSGQTEPEGKRLVCTFTAVSGDLEPGKAFSGIGAKEDGSFLLEARIRTDRAIDGARLLLVFDGALSVSAAGKEIWHSPVGKNERFDRKKPFTVLLNLPEGETALQLKSQGPDGKKRRLNIRMTDRDDAPLFFSLQSGK